MKKISNREVVIENIEKDVKDLRTFSYVLNDKKTKEKLLKGAKRMKNIEVETKDGCSTLLFSDGSYLKTVLPLLKSWQNNETVLIDLNHVKIEEIEAGFDNSQKHMDTKIVIFVDNCRLVLHAYNTTQKLMIQGKNCEQFALNCLVPFFTKKIQEDLEEIKKINNDVKETLGPKKLIKKTENSFNCPQCEIIKTSNSELKVHMKSCHTKPGICHR